MALDFKRWRHSKQPDPEAAPINRQDRGARALQLINSEIMQDALAATRDRVMEAFANARDAESAWRARQQMTAVEDFSAYLLATIQLGRAEVDKLVRERDKMSARKREEETLAEYLNRAREARAEFERRQMEVAGRAESA